MAILSPPRAWVPKTSESPTSFAREVGKLATVGKRQGTLIHNKVPRFVFSAPFRVLVGRFSSSRAHNLTTSSETPYNLLGRVRQAPFHSI